jgi:large subunit ribosomal protein L15
VITFDSLVEHGLVGKKDVVKVLGRGELTSKVSVSAHSFSASAVEAIEKVGGTVNKI